MLKHQYVQDIGRYQIIKASHPVTCYLLPAASATSTDHHNKMASCLHFIVVLCLTSGLWSGANAQKEENPCYDPCKTCPSGWTPFEDHCYMYKHAAKTWADAEVDCIALGGNLASIPNKGVYTFIRQIVNTVTNANKPAWIGGNDLAKEGVWMWSDGTKFVTKLWGPRPTRQLARSRTLLGDELE
ncbi:galactose-specific lectin nattectin-like isoform X2 [Trematomus bernacchii]|uniref:galactose-specific lectin nattectin-like isoform X2 n=1 Tax=Trematomus bernacchii TaxID=40690 RepID=UPI00146C4BE9|nr:galactose-specific lectin nattectin-like isoform X2 [Trematomus bernacchii]